MWYHGSCHGNEQAIQSTHRHHHRACVCFSRQDILQQLMSDTNSMMLSQIASYVEDFAETEDDTTLMCVVRLLAEYHQLKADQHYEALERLKIQNDEN